MERIKISAPKARNIYQGSYIKSQDCSIAEAGIQFL
jgi:hypothetical protein